MANVLAELFQNVASAIREKTGESGTMKPAEFPEKIRAIEAGSGGGTANLIPLTVTKNGKYYPSESFEFGKPFMFKNSYTQAELQMLAAIGTAPDGMSYLYEKGESYLVIMFLGDIRVLVYTTSATEGYVYTEADISEMGLSAGWNARSGDAYVTISMPPSITFDVTGTLHITDMSAVGLLFNVQNCDGFSEVTVNVASGGSGELVPLKVTKNGIYYPTKNVEIGGTYTLKDSFMQEELQALYNLSTRLDEGDAVLFADDTASVALVVMSMGMMAVANGEEVSMYVGAEVASEIGLSEGWYENGETPIAMESPPTFTFLETGASYVDDITALNVLFDLPSAADGFSSVEVAVSGSTEAIIWKVSFIGANSSVLYERPCINEDDCYDPIITEKIETPTKASTIQYNYTYNGWSLTDGGNADDSALKNVTSDRTVYAAFTHSLVMYTVRFWDGDTLLKTQNVGYGLTATPPSTEKSGYIFVSWGSDSMVITQDTDFYGEWILDRAYAIKMSDAEMMPTSTVRFTVISPDATRLACGDMEGIYEYDITVNPYVLKRIYSASSYYNTSDIRAVYSGDGSKLFVIGTNNSTKLVSVWSFNTNDGSQFVQTTSLLNSTNYTIGGIVSSYDGSTVYIVASSYLFTLTDPTTKWTQSSKSIGFNLVWDISADTRNNYYIVGGTVPSGNKLRAIKTSDLSNNTTNVIPSYVQTLASKANHIALAFSGDNKYLFVATYQGTTLTNALYKLDVTTTPYTIVKSMSIGPYQITNLDANHDGSIVAIEQNNEAWRLRFIDTSDMSIEADGSNIEVYPETMAYNKSASFSKDGSKYAFGTSAAPYLYVYDTKV